MMYKLYQRAEASRFVVECILLMEKIYKSHVSEILPQNKNSATYVCWIKYQNAIHDSKKGRKVYLLENYKITGDGRSAARRICFYMKIINKGTYSPLPCLLCTVT